MRRTAPFLIVFALALIAGACGDGSGSDGAGGGALTSIKLPQTEHVQVATGDTVQLADAAGGTPTLAWFWAPH
jgi:hypothetical protein